MFIIFQHINVIFISVLILMLTDSVIPTVWPIDTSMGLLARPQGNDFQLSGSRTLLQDTASSLCGSTEYYCGDSDQILDITYTAAISVSSPCSQDTGKGISSSQVVHATHSSNLFPISLVKECI